jgi:hypothetical protein
MKPVYSSVTGVTNGSVIPMNTYATPFNVGFGVKISGAVNYTVQHTFDDVWSSTFSPSTATWFSHPTIAAQTAAADGNYAFPVTGIRLVGNAGNTGTATLCLIQAGSAAAS